MKNKAILVLFVAILVMVFALNVVMAAEVNIERVDINDITDGYYASLYPGETVPIEVYYSSEDGSDFEIEAWIDGYKSETYVSRDNLYLTGRRVARFSMTMPSVHDMEDEDILEELELIVRVSDKEDSEEVRIEVILEREGLNLEVLSVEAPQEVTAGSVMALDVVLKNIGKEQLEDVYLTATIADLGIERRVYLGDIDELDEDEFECEEEEIKCFKDLDREDAREKKIYLTIPTGVQSGVYSLEIKASNHDFSETVKKSIVITSSRGEILSTSGAKDVAIGESVSYDVLVVNSGDRMALYSIVTEDVKGLIITVDEPIISVPADSSKTVKVTVKATDSADEGTHTITANVMSGEELVKAVGFSANVEKSASGISSPILALTVILVIVFLVLLVILIVLLTKKPTQTEDFEESTSYY